MRTVCIFVYQPPFVTKCLILLLTFARAFPLNLPFLSLKCLLIPLGFNSNVACAFPNSLFSL